MLELPDHVTAFIGISEHLAQYADAVDSGDFHRLEAILSEAEVVLLSGEMLVGAERIRQLYESVYQPMLPLEGTDHRRIKHHLTNLRVGPPDADGIFPAEAYYFVYVASDDGPTLKSNGRYRDRIAWRAGGWAIARHEIVGDL